jgi:uncharacterized protein
MNQTTYVGRKLDLLKKTLEQMESVLIAYSGGVDSALLAIIANDVLGANALSVTAHSPSLADRELEEAKDLANLFHLRHLVIETKEISNPNYIANSIMRCYFCKIEMYSELAPIADREGLRWIVNGTNMDDLGDFRPGLKASEKFRVRSPFLEIELNKAEIRVLAMERKLPIWDKPAQACLSSRVAYGIAISPKILDRIGKAEDFLYQAGFLQVRVRHHGNMASIEVGPDEVSRILQEPLRSRVIAKLHALGYLEVNIDQAGYRQGNLNRGLPLPKIWTPNEGHAKYNQRAKK